jgi:predicted dehydrogenase
MSEQSNHSRRSVLKASTVIATSAMASSFIARNAHAAAGNETLKIGLIGCGGRGSGAAGQALSTEGPVQLVAVADAFEDNAKHGLSGLKKAHGDKVQVKDEAIFAGFDAYKKLIDFGVDVCVIATPPGFRPIHFEYAVQQGKHVFMEKPVSTDAPGVRRVLAAAQEAKKKNLKVAVGLQRHHQAEYIDTIKRIQDGDLGQLILLRAYWNGDRPWVRPRAKLKEAKPDLTEMEYQMRNWYYFNWLCGDHINEQHIHNLDVINWVMNGHPVSAQGVGGRQVYGGPDQGEIFDHHMIEFTYADGTKMLSECRHQPKCWNQVAEFAHGTKGSCNIGGGQMDFYDGKKWKSAAKGKNPYQQEHDDFFAAIRQDKPYSEAEYGAHSTLTAILGRSATYSGEIVTWDDLLNKGFNIMPKDFDFHAQPPTLPDENGLYAVPKPGVTKVYEGQGAGGKQKQ